MIKIVDELEFTDYQEKVFDYLEYLGYPEYVCMFEPEGVSRSIALGTLAFFIMGQSYRMAACTLFGFMWEKIKTGHKIHNMVTH